MKSVAAFHTSQGVYEMEFLEIPPLHVDFFPSGIFRAYHLKCCLVMRAHSHLL